jgi:ring-1,2-phenylacetyl-CoA epoxidase subunit PaaD
MVTEPPAMTPLEWELHRIAGAVPDPELPMLSLNELGVIRRVHLLDPNRAEVELTPTYTGCPAVETMSLDVEQALRHHGITDVTIRRVLSPPWTPDDISDEGRRKLSESGIAPPRRQPAPGPVTVPLGPTRSTAPTPAPPTTAPTNTTEMTPDGSPPHARTGETLRCPHCGSADTELLSPFSSTACTALHRCLSCREPFDHFKEL